MDKQFLEMQAAIALVQARHGMSHEEVAEMLDTIRWSYIIGEEYGGEGTDE